MRIPTCLAALLCIALAWPAQAQTTPPLETILARHYEALGGLDRIKSVQTTKSTGNLVSQGMPMDAVIYHKRPHMLRMEMTTQGMTVVQAYDGSGAWAILPFTGSSDPQSLPAEQAASLAEQADMDGQLVDYQAKGHTVELLGTEEIGDVQTYKLKLTTNIGQERYYYLDADSYLTNRLDVIVNQGGQDMTVLVSLGDYREVEGLMVPHKIRQTINGAPLVQVDLTSVEVGVPLEDSIFVRP